MVPWRETCQQQTGYQMHLAAKIQMELKIRRNAIQGYLSIIEDGEESCETLHPRLSPNPNPILHLHLKLLTHSFQLVLRMYGHRNRLNSPA